jgi:hypothetical protein
MDKGAIPYMVMDPANTAVSILIWESHLYQWNSFLSFVDLAWNEMELVVN